MPDLKAAAQEMCEIVDGSWFGRKSMDACLLAAQALEALAWQAETGAKVKQCWTGERWFCEVADGEYVADTPLGALLAAMEGEEKDGL